jgi:hypothetical protein
MRRYLPAVLIALLLIVAGGWTVAWERIADNLQGRIDAWVTARRADGLKVDYERVAVSGFPFRWHVTVSHPNMAGAGPTGWTWQGFAVEAEMKPWVLRDIPVRFPGDQRFSAGGGNVAETWTVNAAQPDGHVMIDERGRLDQLALDLGDATFQRAADVQPTHTDHLTAHAQLHRGTADHQDDTFDLSLTIDNATLAQTPVALLGPHIEHADVDLAFKGKLPGGNLPSSISVWRDDGGTVDIHRIAVRWGPIDADGNGTIALDERNRLLGAFTARWRGYNEAIDALMALRQIKPLQAAGAKIALNALARQNQSGVNEVNIPLTAQDGKLFVAGFPLLELPELRFE